MGSITQIEKNVKYLQSIKARITYLEELSRNEFTTFEEIELIQKEILNLQDQLRLVDNRSYDKKFENILDKLDIDLEKIENMEVKYVLNGVIVKAEILMIAAKPGQGKSLITLAACNMALTAGTIKHVIYIDADNGGSTLNERGIPKLKQMHGNRFRYIHDSNATKAEMWQLIKLLKSSDLKDFMIVFDSVKNFMGKGDRDKNKDVSELMSVLKELRRQGATVIFLHHTNKPQRDFQELQYAGSSAFEEDTSNAFILKYNEFRKTFILKPLKNRVGKIEESAFFYQSSSHSLECVDLFWAKESEEDDAIRIEIENFIKNADESPIYSQIMKYVGDMGFSKDSTNRVIQVGKGRYWTSKKIREQNNKDVYELMVLNTTLDKSDNSEHPNNTASQELCDFSDKLNNNITDTNGEVQYV
ncbi:MAG: AAA family ATPase [Sulfuricurvum sp.]|nr:AAA family ATPase [Sulfuricurvum sp.]